MAAPEYVPSTLSEQPRRGLDLPPAERWASEDDKHLGPRPAELGPGQPIGPLLGHQGPDQGYALKLARRFEGRLTLRPNEKAADALRGAVLVALKRASLFGRAPVSADIELALGVWGFLDEAPVELAELRKRLFSGASHTIHYAEQRRIVDAVPEATLRMTPAEVREQVKAGWPDLLRLEDLGV